MLRILVLSLFFSVLSYGQVADTLYILQTTDIHGHIWPYNYFTDKEDPTSGLAKIYSKVVEYRKKHKNVVLVDAGDLLQGTPMVYYFNNNEQHLVNPMILTMNYMGYDAFAVGNHDIEQGVFTYQKAEKDSKFPWLSANSFLDDGRTYFKKSTLIERSGIKIGIIGLTTPGIPMWLDKSLFPGMTWKGMVPSSVKPAQQLRRQADVLIGVFHAGFNAEYSKKQSDAAGVPNENASGWVADQIKEFDAVFAGHSHRAGPMKIGKNNKQLFNNAPVRLNAGYWGKNLGVVKIILAKKEGKWQIKEKSAWLESMENVTASPAILDLTAYYHKQTLKYIRTKIGSLNGDLNAKHARTEDSGVMDLIQKAQMDHTGADISFAASFNNHFKMQKGSIHIKDIYGMYKYENFLYMVEMSGQQVKDFLEYSARYFVLNNGKIGFNKEVAGFNYDMAEGLYYDMDIRKPVGKRIVNMRDKTGTKPFDLTKKYKVTLNSYRASGGGGHMAAAKAASAPVLFKSSEEMRNILIRYIEKQAIINPQPNHNWKIIK